MIAVIDQAQSYRQIITQASAELATLEQEHKEKHLRQAAITEEVATIQSRTNARDQQVATTRENVEKLRTDYEQAVVYARLSPVAQATETQLKAHSRLLKSAEHNLTELLERADKENARDEQRLVTLLQERKECDQRLQEIGRLITATRGAQEQAHKSLGQEEYRDIHSQIALVDADIAKAQKQLAAAKEAKRAIVNQGIERVVEWTEYQHELKLLREYSDAATRVLTAYIAYINTLIEEGRVQPNSSTMMEMVGTSDIYAFMHVMYVNDLRSIDALLAKRTRAQQLLARLRRIGQEQ